MHPSNPEPTPEELLLRTALYRKVSITTTGEYSLVDYVNEPRVLDTFCVECGRFSTFNEVEPDSSDRHPALIPSFVDVGAGLGVSGVASDLPAFREILKDHPVRRTFVCARNRDHHIFFDLLVNDDSVVKWGQYPSLADLSVAEIKQWQKVLPKNQHRDYVRAIRLRASGVGAGSLLYLRRVYEHLLITEYDKARQEDRNLPPREQQKVKDLLKNVSGRLPDHMGENPVVYGILSKGVHELDDDEGASYFSVLKGAVDIILLDLYRRREEEIIREQNKRDLNQISSKL